MAQLNKISSRYVDIATLLNCLLIAGIFRSFEVTDVGERGVAPNTEVVLHSTFRRQAIVIPSHRVKHLGAGHTLISGDGVGVGVTKNVADVK